MNTPRLVRYGLLAASLLVAAQSTTAATGKLTLKGVGGDARKNIEAWLSLGQEPCDASEQRLRTGVTNADEEIRQALRAFGYYDPVIKPSFTAAGKNGCWSARFDIDPGKRVSWRTIDVEIAGDADHDERFQKLLDTLELKPGQKLRHDRYDALKNRITNLAAERGYFDSRFVLHELRVDPVAGYADAALHFDSGPRFRFGETRLQQDIITDRMLRRYLAYQADQPYTRTALTETSRALSSSGYFRQVLVQPLIEEAQAHEVPVRITLTPADRHRYSASVGFATDTGPRMGLGYKNVRLNRRGHQFSSDLSLSQELSKLTLGYTIPLQKPVTDKLLLEAGFKHDDNDTYKADTAAISATRTRQLDNGWLEEQMLTFGQESYKIGSEDRQTTLLLMPGIGWSRTFADHHLYPRNGLRLNFKTRGGLQHVLSDVSFLQLIGSAKGILSLPWRSRLISRVNGGVTFMNAFDQLPPSVRFFTGGDTSVRGYSYRSLGPENADGEVEGGKNLLVGSVEFEHMFAEKWGVAAFVDSGNAFDDTRLDPKTGVGFGIRWRSPVGPIRLDLAHPLDDSNDLFRIHFVMGPEL